MHARSMPLLWLMLITFSTANFATAAEQRQNNSFNQEQTQGEVRVILLRVSQLIVSNQPNFVVTYAVEIPVKGAFADLHFSSDKELALSVKGKPLYFPGSFSSTSMDFKALPRQNELIKPKVHEGKAMLAEEIVIAGLKVKASHVDLKIQFSWRGTEMKFDFQGVPTN
jgi:hypothetical protein